MICCCSLAGTKACENCTNMANMPKLTINKNHDFIIERKGKWLFDEERGATGIYAICSCCNESIYQTGDFNFCPNCGADMREEE